MAKGLTLDILADTRQAQKAIGNVSDALENVGDSLNDVVKDSDKGTERMERDFRELSRDVKRESKEAYESVRKEIKDTGRAYDDLKSESNQSLKETAASISSVEDGLDAVQEIAANAFAGFGPAGAVAGLVAATGIGLVTAELQKQQEAADRMKERIASAYQEAAEEGRIFLDSAQVTAEAFDVMFNPDRAEDWKRIQNDARTLGLDAQTVLLANAGSAKDLATVMEAANKAQAEWKDKLNTTDPRVLRGALASQERQDVERIIGQYRSLEKVFADNAKKAQDAQAIKDELAQREIDNIARTKKADQDRYEGVATALGKLPKAVDIPVTVTPNTTALDKVLEDYRNKKVRITADLVDRLGRAVP